MYMIASTKHLTLLIESECESSWTYQEKCLKTAENEKNRWIQTKYRAHGFENGFIALPVPENPMLEKRILKLSPIGKKLGGPPTSFGRHLGFSKLRETPTLRKKLPPLFFKSTSWWTRISNKKNCYMKAQQDYCIAPDYMDTKVRIPYSTPDWHSHL